MQKVYFLLFVLGVVVLELCRGEKLSCSRNEVVDNCKNPCLPTCSEPDRQPCPTFTCSKGCVCRKGLIRDESNGECIPPRLCPKEIKCNKKHEVPSNCTSPCIATCQTPCREPRVCPLFCREGCVCEKGFLRNEVTGECVPSKRCPKCECPDGQIYTRCGAACIQTCQNIKNPRFCSAAQACKAGCICKDNLVLDEDTGKCVKREDCKNY